MPRKTRNNSKREKEEKEENEKNKHVQLLENNLNYIIKLSNKAVYLVDFFKNNKCPVCKNDLYSCNFDTRIFKCYDCDISWVWDIDLNDYKHFNVASSFNPEVFVTFQNNREMKRRRI
jgi:hypothetical protein